MQIKQQSIEELTKHIDDLFVFIYEKIEKNDENLSELDCFYHEYNNIKKSIENHKNEDMYIILHTIKQNCR